MKDYIAAVMERAAKKLTSLGLAKLKLNRLIWKARIKRQMTQNFYIRQ